MKNNIVLVSLILLMLSSCSTVYKCGEPVQELRGSKRLKETVVERDSLCTALKMNENMVEELEEEIIDNKKSIAELERQFQDLNQQYNNLMDANLSQAEQFDLALKQKSNELQAKEKLLMDREKALAEMQGVIARQDSITKQLNDVLRNALLSFNADELSVEIKGGKVYVSMSDKLLFKSGSASVETKGKEALKVLAEVLEKNPDIDILIEGHTDNVPIKTGIYKDNWDLSVGRATSIVRILTGDYKMEPTRLTASGKGEFSPRADNDTPQGRAINRRTEIILSPKLDEIMKLLNQ